MKILCDAENCIYIKEGYCSRENVTITIDHQGFPECINVVTENGINAPDRPKDSKENEENRSTMLKENGGLAMHVKDVIKKINGLDKQKNYLKVLNDGVRDHEEKDEIERIITTLTEYENILENANVDLYIES